MSIEKSFIITCDWCGSDLHFSAYTNSPQSVNDKVKQYGWIVDNFGKDHYCTLECKQKKDEDDRRNST